MSSTNITNNSYNTDSVRSLIHTQEIATVSLSMMRILSNEAARYLVSDGLRMGDFDMRDTMVINNTNTGSIPNDILLAINGFNHTNISNNQFMNN
eukprot:363337_1